MLNSGKVVDFTIKQLLDCGAHFGHRTNYWNPKMARYIYGIRNNTHVFDLQKTAYKMNDALFAIKKVASQNGKILFVGTKKQAQESIANHAKRCGQFYVNHRWLGGMLTNWKTISESLKTLSRYEELLEDPNLDITKKERLNLDKKRMKLDRVLGGIRTLGGKPDLLFVMDCRSESLAVLEARKLGIPVVGVVDSNTDPDNIDHIIPANDDAAKAIEFYCYLASEAALKGLELSLDKSGAQLSAEELIKLHQDQQKAKAQSAKDAKGKATTSKGAKKKATNKSDVKIESKNPASKVESPELNFDIARSEEKKATTDDKKESLVEKAEVTKISDISAKDAKSKSSDAKKVNAASATKTDDSSEKEASKKASGTADNGKGDVKTGDAPSKAARKAESMDAIQKDDASSKKEKVKSSTEKS